MALIVSAASGDFSAGATWVGGIVPSIGDEARASTGHAITIDVNTTCDEVSNAGTGFFILNGGVTLTANVTNKTTTTTRNCLEFTDASPEIGNIVGNCSAGTATLSIAANNLSTGTLNITGNCIGGSGTNSVGVNNNSTGILNITGNVQGGSGIGATGAVGARNNSTGTLNITGTCIGGTGTGEGAINASTGTMLVVGTIEASEFIGGVGGSSRGQVTFLIGPFLTSPTFGVNPIRCNSWRWAATLNDSTFIEVLTSDLLVKRNLVTDDNVNGMPAESVVKKGVVYGPTSELTGEFEQTVAPSVSDIAAAVWDTPTSGLTTSGAIGTRLKNSSTVATTGSQLAAALS
jgi:hypothetical protein